MLVKEEERESPFTLNENLTLLTGPTTSSLKVMVTVSPLTVALTAVGAVMSSSLVTHSSVKVATSLPLPSCSLLSVPAVGLA